MLNSEGDWTIAEIMDFHGFCNPCFSNRKQGDGR